MNEYTFEPGARFPLHRHPQEQITLVLQGNVELTVAGQAVSLEQGSWSVVEGEVEHAIRAGEHGARLVAIIVPRRKGPRSYTLVE